MTKREGYSRRGGKIWYFMGLWGEANLWEWWVTYMMWQKVLGEEMMWVQFDAR